MIWQKQLKLVIIFINNIIQGQILSLIESININMKVNCVTPIRQLPYNNKYQKTLLEEVRESLLKLDWPKHTILFSKLRQLIGCQQQIMLILRECMDRNSKKGLVLNYLYVMDYLLTIESFNVILHKYLVEFYCDLFKHVLAGKDYQGLQQMKIVRKYWVGRIAFNVYASIHEAIMRYFQINIDWIKEQALHDLKKFYLEHLRLNFNDLYFHLPQLKTIDYHPTIDPQRRPIYKPKQPTLNKNQEQHSTTELESSKQEKILKKQTKKITQATGNQIKAGPQLESLKRKRDQSQETTISLSSKRFRYDYQHFGQSSHQSLPKNLTKQSNLKQVVSKVNKASLAIQRGPLEGFNFLVCFNCELCSTKFKLQSQLKVHQQKDCSQTSPQEKSDLQKDCIIIRQCDIFSFTRTCQICYKQLMAQYSKGNWIVKDAIKLTIYDVDTIIHLDCQKQVTPQMTKKYQQQNQIEPPSK